MDLTDRSERVNWIRGRMAETIAIQICSMRKSRGMSKYRLAKLSGVSAGSISRLESPGSKTFKLETLLKVASAFDVAMDVRFVPFSHAASRRDEALSTVPSFAEEYE